MQLSHESYRTRWLVLVTAWTLAAYTLFTQAGLVRDYFAIVGSLGLRGAPAATTPLKQGYPAFAADAQVWVRHALALVEGKDLRLRYTTIDNAPKGREVHWNSAWAWAIAGAGWIHHLFTGDPIAQSIEKATFWLTPSALFVFIVFFSTWATRRSGVIAGVIVVVAMTCHERVFEGFFPSYVDHHGLLAVAVLGLVMGAVFMGAGWWQKKAAGSLGVLPDSTEAARTAAILSGFCGACGLWVSAASVIPPIAIIGVAGVAAIILQGRAAAAQGANFDPDVWRLWGRAGGAASMLFYLLEYFPQHLAMRLEPNHPVYAIAWLGGGELIAQFGERWFAPREKRWANLRQLIWPVAAISVAPLIIAIGGVRVFSVIDPFMARLHNDYIQEFLPMWRTFRNFDGKAVFQIAVVGSIPLLAAIATLSYRRRDTPITLWFATVAAILFTAMAWWQSRWLLNASGVQICLILVVLATWTLSFSPVVRWLVALATVGVLFLPTGIMRYTATVNQLKLKQVSPSDANSVLMRDIAAAIRNSQPEGEIVLLTSPNASTTVGYYGRFKTLGTLYWENGDGLKAAANILAAKTELEAGKLIHAHKVTHIALISEENFVAPYYELLHRGASFEEMKKCFGLRILLDKVVPQWLQMIPYKIPDDLSSLKLSVMLFKVNFQQTVAEALYHVAQAQITSGAVDDGERTLDLLIKQAPQICEPWLRKAELLLVRRLWTEATDHFLKGISLAPPADRARLYNSAAHALYNHQQHGEAVRIYRIALKETPTPDAAAYLGWVLATSKDDSVRNGKEALALASEAIKSDPNSPLSLNSLAAALAENGRFGEAVEMANRAVVNSRLRQDAPSIQATFAQRLETLKAGNPLRF